MNYSLLIFDSEQPQFLEISKDRADAIVSANDTLRRVVAMEEAFDIVIENYLEFEKECLSLTVDHMVTSRYMHKEFRTPRQIINRRIMNLLTTTRSYLTQIRSTFKRVHRGKNGEYELFVNFIRQQHQSSLAYRVMEEVRNHVQHHGFPVHGMRFGLEWIERQTDAARLEFTLALKVKPSELGADGDFKKMVLEELKNAGESFDVRPMLREYISAIAVIHDEFRNRSECIVKECEEILMDGISDYFEFSNRSDRPHGVMLVNKHDSYSWDDIDYLSSGLIEWRREFEQRNAGLKNLEKRYATGWSKNEK